jgi:hypothetical protein
MGGGVFNAVEKWTRKERSGYGGIVSIVDTPGAPRSPRKGEPSSRKGGPRRRKWLGKWLVLVVSVVLALAVLVRGPVSRLGFLEQATRAEGMDELKQQRVH